MPSRKDEPVTSRPIGVAGIMAQMARPQCVCHGGGSHRKSRVARIGLLDGIRGKEPDGVDCTSLKVVCHMNPAC